MNRGFLVPCDAMRVLLRRDTSFRAGLSLGGLMATYSRLARKYQPHTVLVKAISSFSLLIVTKVHMTVHFTLPMRLSLSSSTALLLAVSAHPVVAPLAVISSAWARQDITELYALVLPS